MKKILVFLALILCEINGFDGQMERKFLLNSYYNPNRLVFRLSKYSFECSMLGVSVPFYSVNNACNSDIFRNMSHLTIGYMQNNLHLEQLYGVRIVNGFCIVAYQNTTLNEKMIADGFAVVNKNGVKDVIFLEKLQILQNLAKEHKKGLWNSFYNEMQCFSELY